MRVGWTKRYMYTVSYGIDVVKVLNIKDVTRCRDIRTEKKHAKISGGWGVV